MKERKIHYWTQAMHKVEYIPGTNYPVPTDYTVLCGKETAEGEVHIDKNDPASINFSFNPVDVTCRNCTYLLTKYPNSYKLSRKERKSLVKGRKR